MGEGIPRRNRLATEARILDAVVTLLTSEGWSAIGINRIADQAKCDKVLIYRYFSTVDGLFAALLDRIPLLPEPAWLLAEGAALSPVVRRFSAFCADSPLTFFLLQGHRGASNNLSSGFQLRLEQLTESLGLTLGVDAGRRSLIQALLISPVSPSVIGEIDQMLELGGMVSDTSVSEPLPDHLL